MYRKGDYAATKRRNPKLHLFLKDFVDTDEYCTVMGGDRALLPVHIPLPRPPQWDLIDGYDLPVVDQVFRYVEIPEKLMVLEREYSTIDGIWSEIEKNPLYYKDEIDWMRRQIWHELHGYWFFCHGKATYLPGDYYVYLNFWYLDKGRPDYRDRDRKIFLFDEYLHGLGNFCGFNLPKHRREGATSKAGFKNYVTISRGIHMFGGVQSKTDDHGKLVFIKHIVRGWKRAPFFLKPEYDGTDSPKAILNFTPPANTATKDGRGKKSGLLTKNYGLGSDITTRSSDQYAYDGYLLHYYHGDEVGKTKDVDVYDRMYTIRECLAEGEDIHGWCWNTSTVEEMDGAGGRNFKRICDDSHFHDQYYNESGRTNSWLANLFIPATEGRKGFIGKYGESIIDDPTPEQLEWLMSQNPNKKHYIGAKQDILNYRRGFESKGNTVGLMAYKRKYPIEYKDCWISNNFETGLPLDVIMDRMDTLSFLMGKKELEVRRGNFVRQGLGKYARVTFADDPDGRFLISWWFKDDMGSNAFDMLDGEAYPRNTSWGLAGGDPFKFSKNKSRRFSDGGGAVFRYKGIEDVSENPDDWQGHRFVCTYRYKPQTTEEYCEDMAMMCQYYGVSMCSENNIMDLNNWFMLNGYRHYLKYLINKKTGKFEVNPGVFTSEQTKQKMWSLNRDYLRVHGKREMHIDYLQECCDIEGIEFMGNFDLFAGCSMALIGSDDQMYEDAVSSQGEQTALDDWY